MTDRQGGFADVVIQASAGSGKTYQLSNRYLGLLLAGAPVERVLAATFTRKAAGEILDRVMQRLADAAADDAGCAALASALDRELSLAEVRGVLRELLGRLHRVQVSTLDSFFGRLAGSFALDLGLPAGWRIVEPVVDRRLRREALRRVLDDDRERLATMVHHLFKGESVRSVTRQLFELVGALHPVLLDSRPGAWQAVPRQPSLDDAALTLAADRLAELPVPTTKAGKANRRWSDAFAADPAKLAAGRWLDFLQKGPASKLATDESSYDRHEISVEVAAAYRPLIDHAAAHLVNLIVDQTAAAHGLAESFETHYRPLQHRRRALRFDDVSRSLAVGRREADLAETFHRVDARIDHLLLDEFQDTAVQQWHILRPLAEHVVGDPDRSLLCVGDVKQAIYNWRGGVPELLETLADRLDGLNERRLQTSYRSAQPIVDTVNRVFTDIASNPAVPPERHAVAARWQHTFAEHTTARTGLAGHVRFEQSAAGDDKTTRREVHLAYAADRIAEIAAAAPGRSVGVLTRKNEAVADLIALLHQRGVPASEEGGNPLTDSPAVTLILSLLRLADHPSDGVARHHVLHSPLAAAAGLVGAAPLPRVARELRRRLLDDGYGPVVSSWADVLRPHAAGRDRRRLDQLVTMAFTYRQDASLRPRDFVEHVVETDVEDVRGDVAVRVLTIHRAKGLEFDVVVLPELDNRLGERTPKLVGHRPDPTADYDAVLHYPAEPLRPHLPDIGRAAYAQYADGVFREALCLLYVALTRARHALHILVRPDAGKSCTFAELLRKALPSDAGAGEHLLHEHGDPDWHRHDPPAGAADDDGAAERAGAAGPADAEAAGAADDGAAEAASAAADDGPASAAAAGDRPAERVVRLAPPVAGRSRGLGRRSPSGLEGGGSVDLRDRLNVRSTGSLQRGHVIHALFEHVGWLGDELPAADELRLRLAAEHRLAADRFAELYAEFQATLGTAAAADCLSHAAVAARLGKGLELEVFRELEFMVRQQDALLHGFFDRVVVAADADGPVAAEILDYKTDRRPEKKTHARWLRERTDHYRPQLHAYRHALSRRTGLPESRIAARLWFVAEGVVAAV